MVGLADRRTATICKGRVIRTNATMMANGMGTTTSSDELTVGAAHWSELRDCWYVSRLPSYFAHVAVEDLLQAEDIPRLPTVEHD